MDRKEFQQLLRRVLKTAAPVALLGISPLLSGGCACPTEERTTVVPVTSQPTSFEECIEMCKTELNKHYDPSNFEKDDIMQNWYLGEVHRCTSSTLLTPDSNSQKTTLQNAVICDYEVRAICIGGRLPSGIQPQEQWQATNELGSYFAQLCYLEQAAVVAFDVFAQELKIHNAPQEFVDRALLAVQEEKEHAQMTALLAQMYGAQTPEVTVAPQPIRSLEEIAYENAIEGCVRETYAPLVAHWQALHSVSPEIRAVMSRIAEEESGHAALSWEVDSWMTPQLTPAQRAKKDQLQQEAIATLGQETKHKPSQAMVEVAGFPQTEQATQLFEGLQQELWS